jgi:hypothetical protein
MADESRIERTIGSMVSGCGLDARRQAELTEELHGHLWQLVAAKREEGLSEADAIDAALAQFGSAGVIRGAICRQRRGADVRTVLADVRRTTLGIGVVMALVIAATTADVSLLERCIIVAISTIGLSCVLTLPVSAAYHWCRLQALRAPVGCRSWARVLGWTLRISALLVGLSVAAVSAFGVVTSLYEMSGWSHVYAPSLATNLGRALIQALPSLFAVALFGAILVVIFERTIASRRETHAT